MKVQILGTAAAEGWPGIFCTCRCCEEARRLGGKDIRTRASTLIDDSILIDFSADTYSNALRFGLNLSKVHSMIITHHHSDHFYGKDLLMRRSGVFAHLQRAEPTLTVYGNADVMEEIGDLSMMKQNEVKKQQMRPFTEYELPYGYKFTPLLALHDRNQICCIILVTSPDGKNFLYGHDTGIYPDATFEYLKGRHLDLVTYDCTHGPDVAGDNHMGVPNNVEVRRRLEELGCVDENTQHVITHFSHNGMLTHHELELLVNPRGFEVAYDGAVFTV